MKSRSLFLQSSAVPAVLGLVSLLLCLYCLVSCCVEWCNPSEVPVLGLEPRSGGDGLESVADQEPSVCLRFLAQMILSQLLSFPAKITAFPLH